MNYTVQYVDPIRSTAYPSYYPIPCSTSTFIVQENIVYNTTSILRNEQGLSIQKQNTVNTFCQRLNNIQATYRSHNIELDDTETRKKLWQGFFGDKKLPKVKSNAVKKFYGSLDKYVDWKKVDLDKSRDKIRKFLDE